MSGFTRIVLALALLLASSARAAVDIGELTTDVATTGDIEAGSSSVFRFDAGTQIAPNGDGGLYIKNAAGTTVFTFASDGAISTGGTITGGTVSAATVSGTTATFSGNVTAGASSSIQFSGRTKMVASADGAIDVQTSAGVNNLSIGSTGIITTRPPAGRTEKITIDSYTNSNQGNILADRRLNIGSGAGWELYLTSSSGFVLNTGSVTTRLEPIGNHILSQVNGANAQEFRVANTTNEHAGIQWFSGVGYFGTNVTSSGTHRAAVFGTAGAANASIRTNGTLRWDVGGSTGHLTPNAATTYDVGSESLPVRDIAQGRFHTLKETATTPTAATDTVVLYAKDNGSGKTQLMALFPTGAAVQIAIEP